MIDLLDVNLLIALAWPNHLHHELSLRWFGSRSGTQWATTPITESGFVRVSSNHSAIASAVTPAEAMSLLSRMRSVNAHIFLPDDVEGVLGDDLPEPWRVVSYRSVTDAHLLALARRHGARLATLDRGVKALASAAPDDVLVIPT